MARSDRLLRLLHVMRTLPAPLTAARLAEATGVSLRSLYRDIDSLRAAGARIEGERGYGYRLTEDTALPPQTLDRLEIEALVLGLGEVQHMGDPALARAAASVLAKVVASLPDEREQQAMHAISQVYRPELRYDVAVDVELIRNASWAEQAVRIRYRDEQGATTERTVYPLSIGYAERVLSVLAWCCLRQDFRIFRADRIIEAEGTELSFRPRRVPLLRQYLEQLRSSDGHVRRGRASVAT